VSWRIVATCIWALAHFSALVTDSTLLSRSAKCCLAEKALPRLAIGIKGELGAAWAHYHCRLWSTPARTILISGIVRPISSLPASTLHLWNRLQKDQAIGTSRSLQSKLPNRHRSTKNRSILSLSIRRGGIHWITNAFVTWYGIPMSPFDSTCTNSLEH